MIEPPQVIEMYQFNSNYMLGGIEAEKRTKNKSQ